MIKPIKFGGNLMIFINDGSNYLPIAYSTSATLSTSRDIREQTTKDSVDWVDNVAGMLSWTMSTDGLLNYSSVTGTTDIKALYDYYIDGAAVDVYFAFKSGTTPNWTADTSKKYYTGKALINQFDINAGNKEDATYSISMTGTGKLELV